MGGDEIHFQRGASVTGPASEPREDMRYLVRRFADDRPLPERARLVAKMLVTGQKQFEHAAANLCEGGRLLARRLHLPDEVERALGQVTERWDGKGVPGKLAGEEISRPLRSSASSTTSSRSPRRAIARRRSRRSSGVAIMAMTRRSSMLRSPSPRRCSGRRTFPTRGSGSSTPSRSRSRRSRRPGLASVAQAFGEFTDIKVGFLRGHSARVAELAAAAAEALGCSQAEVSDVRSAGFFHDVGRVAVPNGIWDKPGPLSVGERERVRLHPYYTERVLERSGALAPLALLAGCHHERLDGSGYHRGATAAQLSVGARVLAAADIYDAMTHDRPHRRALRPEDARTELGEMVRSGRAREADGRRRTRGGGRGALNVRQGHPAGLSDREVEVLRLLAQGRTSRQIAHALVITEKTAGHHVEHIYAKLGVSTRVGATLFAMQHDLAD